MTGLFSSTVPECKECGHPATIKASTGAVCGPCCPDGEKPSGPVVNVLRRVDRVLEEKKPEVNT